jgi:hypothetical protein
MPPTILPLFPEDITLINSYIGVAKRDGVVYYFQGSFPFYHHREESRSSFKHVVCQMLTNNMAKRCEISRAFKIHERSISRWLALFQKEGEDYFFSKP